MQFKTQDFTKSDSGTYVAEASTLGIRQPDSSIILRHEDGSQERFGYYKTDWDGCGSLSWRFRSLKGSELLIIND